MKKNRNERRNVPEAVLTVVTQFTYMKCNRNWRQKGNLIELKRRGNKKTLSEAQEKNTE